MTFEYRGRSVDIRDGSTKHQRCYESSWMASSTQFLMAKRLVDAELDKNFGQNTVGLKGSEIDIRRCTKEDLDAINERARAWKAQRAEQTGHQPASPGTREQLELPITEEATHEFPD